MSDAGRKDFSTSQSLHALFPLLGSVLTRSSEAKEGITPDSTKSTQEKIKEGVTDTTDRLARYLSPYCLPLVLLLTDCSGIQPDSEKSTGQAAMDKTQRTSDREVHGGTGETM